MTSNLPKLTRFFTNYLLPELLTRQFKLTGVPHDPHSSDADDEGDDGIFCLCRETAYGDMVACDGPDCPYEGFHFVCVELKNPKVYGFVLSVMHAHRLLPNGCVVFKLSTGSTLLIFVKQAAVCTLIKTNKTIVSQIQ